MSQSVDSLVKLMCTSRIAALAATLLFVFAASLPAQQPNASGDHQTIKSSQVAQNERHEQWDLLKVSLRGPKTGNPFSDVEFAATFQQGDEKHLANGFYDGEGIYRVRFMPSKTGRWQYTTRSNVAALNAKTGHFDVVAASKGNHGPVRVHNTFHFAYSDGTPYKPLGTTCYAWTSQDAQLEQQTLKTLAASPFNKLRMCVFPKWYTWNKNEPPLYAFEGSPQTNGTLRSSPQLFSSISNSELRNCVTSTSRPISSFSIRTMKGIGDSTACLQTPTIGTHGTSSVAWLHFAMCGGRSRTNTTS